MKTGRTIAWLNLAYHFGAHVLLRMPRRLFGHGPDAQRFRSAVLAEGYVPLEPAERALLPATMGCISCGLCALAGDTLIAPASAWEEAWTFVVGPARSLDRAPLAAAGPLDAARDPAATAVCPAGVPIDGMATMLRRLAGTTALLTLITAAPLMAQDPARPRARDIGIEVGVFATGRDNAITDVAGVRVGHATLRGATGNTGVTAVLPPGDDWFRDRVPAAVLVGNGFGKLVGVTQLRELGELETPILLTCTLCVWRAADAMVAWLLARPGMQNVRSINPVVGETNDGALNDIRARPVTSAHVVHALENAAAGAVEEGAVGAGAGTVAFGWKGGIGTASRVLPQNYGGYTLGVIVQSNYGGILTIDGVPVGRELGRYAFQRDVERAARDTAAASDVVAARDVAAGTAAAEPTPDGSIMIVIATDAPLDARNLERLARRALFGLARTGATMSNGSGDYVIAFSTAESVRRRAGAAPADATPLANDAMTPLFQAVAEAAEEAIYNSLLKAITTSYGDTIIEALPIDRLREILRQYGR